MGIDVNTSPGSLLTAALDYADRGWKIVPLADRDKLPRIKEWQKKASDEEEQITAWWKRWPQANVGVQLGRRSGIVDFECDSPEAEEQLISLFDDSPPVCPIFQAHRGKHRLFKWRENLGGKAVLHFGAVEIRIGAGLIGAQSVFPPSIHPDGAVYRWLLPPDEVAPPEIPERVLVKIWNLGSEGPSTSPERPPDYWLKILKGVEEGHRNVAAVSLMGRQLGRCPDVFDNTEVAEVWLAIADWNNRNKPPLEEKKLKDAFELILAKERDQRTSAAAGKPLSKYVRRDPETGKLTAQAWKLVKVTSEPPRFKLFSPMWQGPIWLTASEYRSPEVVAREALNQADTWIPGSFAKLWRGDKNHESLAGNLVANMEIEEDMDEARRSFIIAEWLYTELTNHPKPVHPGEEFDSRGIPCLTDDGDYVFKFSEVLRPMRRSDDKILAHELTGLLNSLGVKYYFPRIAGRTTRRHLLPRKGMIELQKRITK